MSRRPSLRFFLPAANARAEQRTSGDWTYELGDPKEAKVVGYNGLTGAVAIPDNLDNNRVTSIGRFAFAGCTGLTTASIPHGLDGAEGRFPEATRLERRLAK